MRSSSNCSSSPVLDVFRVVFRYQYKDYVLFCPFAYRMLEGPILAKDLAVEYKYLANTSEWFYIARKNAERVIRNMTSLTKGKLNLQLVFLFFGIS